jgi:protein phosphatase
MVREVNEDACLEQPERGLWAVADGMGGHALGEFASRLVIRSLTDLPAPQSLAQYIDDAHECLQDANRRLRSEAAQRDVPIIGTTIVALLASERHAAFLWAGDSRVYLCRAGRLRLAPRELGRYPAPPACEPDHACARRRGHAGDRSRDRRGRRRRCLPAVQRWPEQRGQ